MGMPFVSGKPQDEQSLWLAMHPDAQFQDEMQETPEEVAAASAPEAAPAEEASAEPDTNGQVAPKVADLKSLKSLKQPLDLQGAYDLANVLGANVKYTPPKEDYRQYGLDVTKLENAAKNNEARLKQAQLHMDLQEQNRKQLAERADKSLALRADLGKQRLALSDEGKQFTANSQYDKKLGNFENGIQSGVRAKEILNEIAHADPADQQRLLSTPHVVSELNSSMAALFAQGKTTVHGQQALEQNDVYSKANKLWSELSAQPVNTLSPAKLQQMQNELSKVLQLYGGTHKVALESFLKGIPEQRRAQLEERATDFRQRTGLEAPKEQAGKTQIAGTKEAPPVSGGLIPSVNAGVSPQHPTVTQKGVTYHWNAETKQYE